MIIQSERIRKQKYAVSDPVRIEQIIRNAHICRLGFVDNGMAYIVPMNFGYEEGVLYFHTGTAGKKMALLRSNPEVTFEIESRTELTRHEQACHWDIKYSCVMGAGLASEILDTQAKRKALGILMNHYLKKAWTFPEQSVVKTSVFQVRIETISAKSNIEDRDS